jgi:hypothetical protein
VLELTVVRRFAASPNPVEAHRSLIKEFEAARLAGRLRPFQGRVHRSRFLMFRNEDSVFYQEILEGLYREKIRYLIVGGLAVNLHGVPRATFDLDLILSTDASNITRFCDLLKALGYVPRLPVDPLALSDEGSVQEWIAKGNMNSFSFYHALENRKVIDVVLDHPLDFPAAFERKTILKMDDTELYLASLDDLMEMKRNTGRQKDASDVDMLSMAKRSREEGSVYGF